MNKPTHEQINSRMDGMHKILARIFLLFSLLLSSSLQAAGVDGEVAKQATNITAITIFFAFVAFTLVITWHAAKRSKSREAFYTAANGITPWQNAFAIAGDFMSAATLLGITGLMFFRGYDAYILSFTVILGWTLALIVVAERLRNLGKFTFVDVVSYRLNGHRVRALMAICSLAVILFYLIGQIVGAGKLIQLLFGMDYIFAVVIVSVLMVLYVFFGGMIATTWVQMIKAGLLLFGGAFFTVAILARFDFSFATMLENAAEVHSQGAELLAPGGWLKGDILNVWTVGLTMTFGIMGLPHVLMRFFTVKDGAGARKSVAYATILMAFFYLFILVIGFGAVALIWGQPEYYDAEGNLRGGINMVALVTAQAVGGDLFLGFMSAVAFATILAVVAGLTLAAAAAIAHDLYAVALCKGEVSSEKELRVSKIVTLIIGLLCVLLGLAFEKQNIAVVVAIALAIAASVNFPLLILSMYWRGTTTQGALVGGTITLVVTLIVIVLSDAVWVQILGNEKAIFPYAYPTVLSMPLGFLSIWLFSIIDKSQSGADERARFDDQFVRAETGIGAEQASSH